MDTTSPPFDRSALEAMNHKAIENQFFTPDRIYIDFALMKDIPLGAIYADLVLNGTEETFVPIRDEVVARIHEYQKRRYETIDPFFSQLGYSDEKIEQLLTGSNVQYHDAVFMMAPTTHFLEMLIRHMIRNQNNSQPAAKYTKKMIDKDHYVMESEPITLYVNTYPLTLSPKLLTRFALELGESLGVNIQFLSKDPMLFDKSDWDKWMSKIDCYYLHSLGRLTRSAFVLERQGNMEFSGRYFFARKRFEKCVMGQMQGQDFDQQIQMVTAQLDIFCDFAWLQNNDVRLTDEKEDVPLEAPAPE